MSPLVKARDLNLRDGLSFDFESGVTSFRNTRLLLFDADAMGLLRQGVYEQVGWDAARRIFFRFGFQHGFSDFLQIELSHTFDSELELLASGPVMHTWQGLVRAQPTEIDFDRDTGRFHFTGDWLNSYEAQQYLTFNEPSSTPVCWSLTGYATGWCSAFFGRPLLAVESRCVGMGHDTCGWLIRPEATFGADEDALREAIRDLRPKVNGEAA
ncbi:MAG: XylR N-terminal domain-containing protein [Deltaproteobacteria bacterium]|nr:XylR N-terminal domain-containing protein [Deltaproteobacteria bacterium]